MNLGLENARAMRKRTYDDVTTGNLDSDGNAIEEVGVDDTTGDDGEFPQFLLRNLLGQFDAESSLEDDRMSQQQIRVRRETSAKILNVMKKLMMKSIVTDPSGVESTSCCYEELRMAVEALVDRWGLGDIQICNILVETLLQTYFIAPTVDRNVALQEFILLELLPCATGGDSENCHHLQSAVAKTLIQAIPKCGKSFCMYKPMVSWCIWYTNYLQYHKQYEVSLKDSTASFPVPGEINQLALDLLRTIPSIDLLPSVLRINLDFLALTVKADSISRRHSDELIATLRQRWTELLIPQDFIYDHVDTTRASDAIAIRECHRHMLDLFETAIFDQDVNDDHLLIDSYVKLLKTTSLGDRELSELHLPYGTHNKIMKHKSNCDSNADSNETNILTIDWIFVMMLLSSERYRTMAVTLVDAWCQNVEISNGHSMYLHDSLSEVIKIVFLNPCTDQITESPLQLANSSFDSIQHKNTQQRLVPCLLQMASVLILKPQRDYLSHNGMTPAGMQMPSTTDSQIDSLKFGKLFIQSMFDHLDHHRQRELIKMMLHIVDECLCYSGLTLSKRVQIDIKCEEEYKNDDSSAQRAISTVIKSVFAILHHITTVNSMSVDLRGNLMERLTLSGVVESDTIAVDREICILLVSSMKLNINENTSGIENDFDRSEILILLQKLLFGESSRSSTTHAIRGMLLATELLSINHYLISINKQKLIQEWVLRRLLPSSRRMVEPEVGLAGLSFLEKCIDSNAVERVMMTRSFFQRVKLMVANTGLVQVLENYRSAGASTILAFSSPVVESTPSNTCQEDPRAVLFGINFFLRRSNEIVTNPSRWSHATKWVYVLVDTYLQMGRTTVSKSWNPLSWLQASLEFPTVDTSFFNAANETQRLIADFIAQKVCQLDVSKGIQDVHFFPGSYADVVVRRLFSKKLKLFIDSLRCFAVALLIGMSLSSAVLKNAYEFTESTNNTLLDVQKYMIFQINKIYDLRAKSITMDSLFASIGLALRRSWLKKKRVKVVLSDESSENGNISLLPSTRRNQVSCLNISPRYCTA